MRAPFTAPLFVAALGAALILHGGNAMGAEIAIMSAGAVEPALEHLAAQYAKASGNKVTIRYNTAPQLAQKLAEGTTADILIAPPALLDQQTTAGKLATEGRAVLGRVGVGVIVRKGATAPDVSSVEALKRAVTAADSVVYNTASTGLYLEKMFERLGLAETLKAKTTRYPNGPAVLEHVIAGKGNEIGFGAIPEIRMYEAKGLRLVGPLPAEVQNTTTYAAAVMTASKQAGLAREFIGYLTAPAGRAAMQASGVDP